VGRSLTECLLNKEVEERAARGKARRRQSGAPLGCRRRHYSLDSSTLKLSKSGERGCTQVEDGEDRPSGEWSGEAQSSLDWAHHHTAADPARAFLGIGRKKQRVTLHGCDQQAQHCSRTFPVHSTSRAFARPIAELRHWQAVGYEGIDSDNPEIQNSPHALLHEGQKSLSSFLDFGSARSNSAFPPISLLSALRKGAEKGGAFLFIPLLIVLPPDHQLSDQSPQSSPHSSTPFSLDLADLTAPSRVLPRQLDAHATLQLQSTKFKVPSTLFLCSDFLAADSHVGTDFCSY
jgi:hypothetical protein